MTSSIFRVVGGNANGVSGGLSSNPSNNISSSSKGGKEDFLGHHHPMLPHSQTSNHHSASPLHTSNNHQEERKSEPCHQVGGVKLQFTQCESLKPSSLLGFQACNKYYSNSKPENTSNHSTVIHRPIPIHKSPFLIPQQGPSSAYQQAPTSRPIYLLKPPANFHPKLIVDEYPVSHQHLFDFSNYSQLIYQRVNLILMR